jgi:hypothetical protein
MRQEVTPLRKEQLQQNLAISAKAKAYTAKLAATPKFIRENPNVLFIDKTSEVPHTTQLEAAELVAMQKGAEAFQASVDKRNTRVQMSMDEDSLRIAVGEDDYQAIIAGNRLAVDESKACALLHSKHRGADLVRVRGLLDAAREKAKVETCIGATETPALPTTETPEEPGESPEPATSIEAINQRVLGSIADIPQNGQALPMKRLFIGEKGRLMWGNQTPEESTESDWNPRAALSSNLGQSPADVPAFHDFYQLQIAFKHIWTEAFDPELRGKVEELYEAVAQLHEDYGQAFDLLVEAEEITDIQTFLQDMKKLGSLLNEPVPEEVSRIFAGHVNEQIWNQLSDEQQRKIIEIASKIAPEKDRLEAQIASLSVGYQVAEESEVFKGTKLAEGLSEMRRLMETAYEALIYPLFQEGLTILENPDQDAPRTRLIRLLEEISQRLCEPYAFEYFASNSVNFGLMLTYRQLWQPLLYQVGDLAATIPLAPGEKRKFESKQVIKRTRAEKELDKALSSRSGESTKTTRSDVEIINKASLQSNFKMTAEGSLRFAIGEINATTEMTVDQAQESATTKKDFREAVLKAAEEYKQERQLEVSTTDEMTTETTTSGELSNPNNEITVTYLLYELERQYRIYERIHRVTPVVLVAQDIPAPNEITESWLLAHDWILRRVLLDDSLQISLDYLTDAFAGDELSTSIRKANWEKQLELVDRLEGQVIQAISTRDLLRAQVLSTEEARAMAEASEPAEWLTWAKRILMPWDPSGWIGEGLTPTEQYEIARKTFEARLADAEAKAADLQERLIGAKESLNEATRAYTDALQNQTNRRVAIDKLRIHVKENILYYMQAIWDHEPPDQRFFRLYNVEATLPERTARAANIQLLDVLEGVLEAVGLFVPSVGRFVTVSDWDVPRPPAAAVTTTKKRLVEIADLDHPLGYKGNYIIFPLKICTHLTNFMMREFFDDYFGVRDPDDAGNYTMDEMLALYNDPDIKLTQEQRTTLENMMRTWLQTPRRDSDIVVVPTGELFIEALLGKHSLLEDFKMVHRGYDVAKVRAEVRQTELENLRRAARLLQADPNLEDPDIDKHIVVEGNAPVQITETP